MKMTDPALYRDRDAADQVRQEYTTQVEEVRTNLDLSSEGRQRRLADLYVKAQSRLQKLGAAEAERLTVRRISLERDLFGAKAAQRGLDVGAHAISARDAADRAARVKSPDEAAELLRRAESDGDEILVRAIARQSSENSYTALGQQADAWDDVVREYLDARQDLMPVVSNLAEIERLTAAQVFSPFALPRPQGVSPVYINRATSTDGEQPARPSKPLIDPHNAMTTHQQRQEWAEATGVSQ